MNARDRAEVRKAQLAQLDDLYTCCKDIMDTATTKAMQRAARSRLNKIAVLRRQWAAMQVLQVLQERS